MCSRNSLKSCEKEVLASAITPDLISAHLTTREIPDPELLIRTSGEHRISNFYFGNWRMLNFILQKSIGQISVKKS